MAAPAQPRIEEPDPPKGRAPRIPYGRADFRGIRLDGSLYVDKTRFVHRLEEHNYMLFIRPRRFGKTCWLSMLECYYGRHHRDEFVLRDAGEIAASSNALRHERVRTAWVKRGTVDASELPG